MSHQQQCRLVFSVGPVLLIAAVFLVTLLFSPILTPLWLTLPLLVTYYAVIWLCVAMYQRLLAGDEPVLKCAELRPAFRGLSLWMIVYQRSGNLFPDIFAHTVTNVLVVFPAAATTMLSLPCAAHSPLAG